MARVAQERLEYALAELPDIAAVNKKSGAQDATPRGAPRLAGRACAQPRRAHRRRTAPTSGVSRGAPARSHGSGMSSTMCSAVPEGGLRGVNDSPGAAALREGMLGGLKTYAMPSADVLVCCVRGTGFPWPSVY